MARTDDLQVAIDAIGALTRQFAASGRRPFAERKLGRSHMDILFALSRAPEGRSVGERADILSVTSGAVSQLLDGLRVETLVTTVSDPADGRRRLVQLTEQARTEVDRFQRHYLDDLAPQVDRLSDAEVARLARLLAKLDRGPRD